jgi:hypothetical protein
VAWYVFALVDVPPHRPAGRGFAAPIAFERVPGGFAAAERRGDVPPIEMDALKQHDAIVARIWAQVPAILPVRFGTFLELDELRETLMDRDEDLADAFAVVRERAQFSWRNLRAPMEALPSGAPPARSGAEYLRRAAGQGASIPARYGAIRKAVAPYVQRERFQPAMTPRPERLYHLVARGDIKAYETLGRKVTFRAAIACTGPWPPYAFAPEML